jgi:hypothetical protein
VPKSIQVSESYPILWIIPNDHKSVENWRNSKKLKGIEQDNEIYPKMQ